MNNVQMKYLKEIKKLLPCKTSEKKRYLTELDFSISRYLLNHPDASYEDLCSNFGSPKIISEAYIEHNSEHISHRISIKRCIFIALIVFFIIAAAIIVITANSIKDDVEDLHDGYYVDTIEDSSPPVTLLPSPLTEN